VAQKFHFANLRIEVTCASRGISAISELLVLFLGVIITKCYGAGAQQVPKTGQNIANIGKLNILHYETLYYARYSLITTSKARVLMCLEFVFIVDNFNDRVE